MRFLTTTERYNEGKGKEIGEITPENSGMASIDSNLAGFGAGSVTKRVKLQTKQVVRYELRFVPFTPVQYPSASQTSAPSVIEDRDNGGPAVPRQTRSADMDMLYGRNRSKQYCGTRAGENIRILTSVGPFPRCGFRDRTHRSI